MTLFKRVLFFTLFIPMALITMFTEVLKWVCHLLTEGFHHFEGWALDYNTHYRYAGDGIWVGKRDVTSLTEVTALDTLGERELDSK